MPQTTDETSPAVTDQAPKPHMKRKADERGLTTLEWLLIVAAVAGLAALAVVLVQNVVSDTSEQIAGSSARKTAAIVAADQIQRQARRDYDEQPAQAKSWGGWADFYASRCNRLGITYGDANITVQPNFVLGSGVATDASVMAASVATPANVSADIDTAAASMARAHCRIS